MENQPDIADFDDLLPPEDTETQKDEQHSASKKVTTFAGVNCANFKDFLLKNELNRAI